MTDNLPVKAQLHGGGSVVALVPQTLDEAYRLADALSRSGLTPYNIKTPEAVMACLLAGAELGFPPFQSLQSFAVINGRPSIYGAAVPALLWSRGFDIDEIFEGSDESYPDGMKAVCTVTRPNGKKVTREFSVGDARRAKLWEKRGRDGSDTPWITNPKRMLQMRARGFAAQDGASDIMRGLPLYEEAQDFTPIRDDDPKAGTGMVERLAARVIDVDAQGFNVRSIAENISPDIDVILAGDQIPTFEKSQPEAPAPKRRGRPPKVKESVAAAESETPATSDPVGGEDPLDNDAQPAQTDNPSSESAMGVSSDSAGETGGPMSSAERALKSPELDHFLFVLDKAESFGDVKSALAHFRRTEFYKAADPVLQRDWQSVTYERLDEMREAGINIPTPETDPWTFSLFIMTASLDDIPPAYEALKQSGAYAALNDAQKAGIEEGVAKELSDKE